MNYSGKLMWACVAVVALALVLAVAFTTPYSLLFVVPCIIMLGAMVWMMGGMGGGSTRRKGQG
jgi:hypothetical protein